MFFREKNVNYYKYVKTNRTLKYLDNRRKKLLKKIEVKLSIGSLAFYMRPIDFPYPPRDEFGFFNTE